MHHGYMIRQCSFKHTTTTQLLHYHMNRSTTTIPTTLNCTLNRTIFPQLLQVRLCLVFAKRKFLQTAGVWLSPNPQHQSTERFANKSINQNFSLKISFNFRTIHTKYICTCRWITSNTTYCTNRVASVLGEKNQGLFTIFYRMGISVVTVLDRQNSVGFGRYYGKKRGFGFGFENCHWTTKTII